MTTRTLATDQPPTGAVIGHFVLRTAHLDDSIAFYGDLLGMRVRRADVYGAALWNDSEHHRIALMAIAPGGHVDMQGPGFEHIAFKLRGLGDLLANHKRLSALGITPFATVHHGGTISAYYQDPDGVQVETFVDTNTLDVCSEMLSSDEFAENPVGVPIDLDDLATRYEAGEPLLALLQQPEVPDDAMAELMQKLFAVRTPPAA